MEEEKVLDEMSFSKNAIIGAALTASTLLVYDEMTPPAATYIQQIDVAPKEEPAEPDDIFAASKVDTGPTISTSVIVDTAKTPIPVMDDYPKSPEEAAARARGDQSNNNGYNFGLVNK